MASETKGGVDPVAPGEVKVRRALLSVSDKRGLVDFARGLAELGVEIVSTGGTAKELQDQGIAIRPVEDYTGFPEILDGRVKTLHPRIHAGLLAVRSDDDHVSTLNEHEIEPIDLVCVNLYPFERVSTRRGVEDHEVIENIDVGGPTLIRAAAKNHDFAAVVVTPESYDAVLDELRGSDGMLSGRTRESLALEAFAYTARYDTAIARWFGEREDDFPTQYTMSLEKVLDLPYGENPHQRAALYAEVGARTTLLSMVSKLHGKELSFNNLLDLDSGRRLVDEFELPAVAIIKHNNPCGVAVGAHPDDAFELALATDRQSAYGGIVCLNRGVERALAHRLNSMFLEAVLAPGFSDEALEILQAKPDLRLLENQERRRSPITEHDMKRVRGGLLVQDRDTGLESREEMRAVTQRKPSEEEWGELIFAMRVCKHVRSNAIVMSKGLATAGVGAGQMSRVDSVRIAIDKAGHADIDLTGAVMASDAFFPFADGPETAIEAGIKAIIQPGGSRRDAEVVEACDKAEVAMVFTARRHFRH
jgi:phosphoribosylaminoimidazolecarboxamide formyltransferase / IMP cyclohydrolase